MYKYVKGITVLSEEKMPDSLEIAQEYSLWMPLIDSLTPNGELIEFLVKAYIDKNNFKTSEYYYITQQHFALKVYPRQFIEPIMKEFLDFLNDNNIVKDPTKIYSVEDIEFMYFDKRPNQECEVISLEEFKKRKEGNNNEN